MKMLILTLLLASAAFAQPPDLTHFETVREQNGIVSLVNTKTISGQYEAIEFDALITQYRVIDEQRYLNPYFYLHVRIKASCGAFTYAVIRSDKVIGEKVTREVPDKPKAEKAEKETDVYMAIEIVCKQKFGIGT